MTAQRGKIGFPRNEPLFSYPVPSGQSICVCVCVFMYVHIYVCIGMIQQTQKIIIYLYKNNRDNQKQLSIGGALRGAVGGRGRMIGLKEDQKLIYMY